MFIQTPISTTTAGKSKMDPTGWNTLNQQQTQVGITFRYGGRSLLTSSFEMI
jgi:hypothetical protein